MLGPAIAMECPTVINKIVFTSPEAMVEFSGEKVKSQPSLKTLLTYVNLYSYDRLIKKTSSLSPITNHAKTLCKECETKSLTIQALGQL